MPSSSGATGRRPARRSRDTARSVAIEAVRRVVDEDAYSNLVLPALLDRSSLSERDRHLAAELGYGTIRRLPGIDGVLAPLLKRPLASATPKARAALRVGAYQLLFTRVPDHAAVGETVGELAASDRGFVNAVLRKVAGDEGARATADAVPPVAPWVIDELRRLLGDEADHAARALAEPAGLTLRVNDCVTDAESLSTRLREDGHDVEPGRLRPGSIRLPGGRPPKLPGFAEGAFAVQDEASSFVVDVLDPQPGERVLDAAAGPGGKACDIACRSGSVVAADASLRRVALVGDSARRLGVRALLLAQDAARPALTGGFDRVLLDAPCSGLGSARRRPELLWRPRKEQLSALARLQVRLALGAAGLVREGGVFVYSVCTFPRAETDAVCRALLAKDPGIEPLPFRGPGGEEADRARLWPHRHGTDAMFIARFRRSAEAPGSAGASV